MKQFLILLLVSISVLTVKAQNANQFFPEKDLITTKIITIPNIWTKTSGNVISRRFRTWVMNLSIWQSLA